ncbi:MAG: DUF5666 domain-containing protein [Patescibacteria group bacterium]
MKKFLPVVIAIVIIIGGGAFYGGMKYAESKNSSFKRNGFPDFGKELPVDGQRFNGGAGRSTGGNFTSGEIISVDDRSLTVKFPDGGSKIIFFSDSTKITKLAEGIKEDLKVGETVTASGTANDDGSITAEVIQLRPVLENPMDNNSDTKN